MKWRGETEEQWIERVSKWHRVFCLFPRQMRNGDWVWLEHCWCIFARKNLMGQRHFVFSNSVTEPEDIHGTLRPLKPKPKPKG